MSTVALGHTTPAYEGSHMRKSRARSALLTRLIVIVCGSIGDESTRATAQGCAGRTSAVVGASS